MVFKIAKFDAVAAVLKSKRVQAIVVKSDNTRSVYRSSRNRQSVSAHNLKLSQTELFVMKGTLKSSLDIMQTVSLRIGSVPKIDSLIKVFCPD